MPRCTARWFALTLLAFLLAEPVSLLAFGIETTDGMSCPCCKGMHGVCSCKMHRHTSGPAFTSRDCCDRCQVSVPKSQPVAEAPLPTKTTARLVAAISAPVLRLGWIPYPQHEAPSFQRPPPALA